MMQTVTGNAKRRGQAAAQMVIDLVKPRSGVTVNTEFVQNPPEGLIEEDD